LRVEQLEARLVLSGQAILANDAFTIHQNGPQSPLAVRANDTFDADYAGQRLITSVSFGSQGGRLAISADKHNLLYTPPADFAGTETFVYAVDGQYTAEVSVSIVAPLTSDHYQIPPDGTQRTLDLLANDPFWVGYGGPGKITSVSVGSAGGTVKISADHRSILYTPPAEEFGKEQFTYVVDDLYPAQVTIDVPTTLNNDAYERVKYEPPTTLNVLANDPFWAGYAGAKQITHVMASQFGANIQISADGHSLIYTHPAHFPNDYSWQLTDTFKYVVDGGYEATVTMTLHRPVQDDWFSVDENSTGYFFNVTQNDTYRDNANRPHDVIDRVTSVVPSEHGGTVAISAEGHGILYTPPAGYVGEDHFTYIADGSHEARVTIAVTQPVRDDNLTAFQDTPNKLLNVLGNDFAGNGYGGARLITAVGPAANGGTVTVRADGKSLLYTPPAGYTGADNFTYEVDGELTATVWLQVAPLAQPDMLRTYPDPQLRPYTIDVLSNDYFQAGYVGAGVLTGVEIVQGSGQVSIQNGRVVFDPASAGAHTLRYTVDGQYQGTVSVWIENVARDDHAVVDENSHSNDIEVFGNDFYINYPPYSYAGPRILTGVTQSANGGTVTIGADGHTVRYQPPADFAGQDTFTYTVDNFMTATVSVDVIRRVRDDQFRVDAADGPQVLPLLVNDPFGADYSGPGQITAVTTAAHGATVAISADGHSVVYTPPAGFVGTDTFTYTVDGTQKAKVTIVVDAPQSELVQKFAGLDSYVQFLVNDALARYEQLFGQPAWSLFSNGTVTFQTNAVLTDDSSRDHSETNVQVAGIDEGDRVEFDSDFIYMLSGSDVVILNAWPADQLSVASRISVVGNTIAEYLHGDRLTVISTVGGGFGIWGVNTAPVSTIVTIIDVSDRNSPAVVQKTKMDGRYIDSRGVGDFVYVLVSNANAVAAAPQIVDSDNDPNTPGRYETREEYLARIMANPGALVEAALPGYTSTGPNGQVRAGLLNSPDDIYQPLVDGAANLLSVVSISVAGNEPGLAGSSAVYSTGASTIYASLDHFYVFDADWTREDGAVTRIMKFDWQPTTGGIDFDATTTVPGGILNQFSIDESGPYLRIATTASNYLSGNWTGRAENTLFVLQEDDGVFEYVGGLHNLALDESMQSVRFMGDRAFITTFRAVDPLFAIDLSDPARPESVGHITVPGYSTYMQLIDENHLLTVGRNTPSGMSGPTQVALFDISNLLQPLRVAEYTFDRFSTSEAQLDHHAFGYYADLGLLAMPISTDRVERVDLDGDGYRETTRTVPDYQLAIFSVDVSAADPADRLMLKTEIEHGAPVRRSGFIGDMLYSIADDSVKVVDVAALGTIVAQVTLSPPPSNVLIEPFPLVRIDDRAIPDASSDITSIGRSNVPIRIGDFSVVLPFDPPAPAPPDPLVVAVAQARSTLAGQLHGSDGEPLLVTIESAGESDYSLVFRIHDTYYWMRTATVGTPEFVDPDFQFGDLVGAWHAVAPIVPQSPVDNSEPAELSGEALPPMDAREPAAPETSAPAAQSPRVEERPSAIEPAASPVTEATQNPAIASGVESVFASAAHRSPIYVVDDTRAATNVSHHRNFDEVFRQTGSDSGDHLLLLSTPRSHHAGRTEFRDEPNERRGDDSSSDVSDVDDAFASILSSPIATKSHRHALARIR
jgi:uncharacterized secreted protein with C-terminal beta-propeller domain